MLVISRKLEEGIRVNGNIEIRIFNVFSTDASGGKKSKAASIGINAPREIQILRKELFDTRRQNLEAEESVRNLAVAETSASHLAGILRQKRKIAEASPDKPSQ